MVLDRLPVRRQLRRLQPRPRLRLRLRRRPLRLQHRRRQPRAAMPAHDPTAAKGALPHASPSIRKFARELGVPLAEVKGSGPEGPHHAGAMCRASSRA